jgi:4-amino-4-deoxy-L-arabinose transferase-like glycosyltransferase
MDNVGPATRPPQIFNPGLNLLLGFLLVAFGQYLMGRAKPVLASFSVAEPLNKIYRWDIPNLDNTLAAIVLFVVGGALFIRAARMRLAPEEAPGLAEVNWRDRLWINLRALRELLIIGGLVEAFLLWQLNAKQDGALYTALWLIVIGMALAACEWWDERYGISLCPRLDRGDIVIMLALVIASIALSVYQLQNVPNLLMGDEGDFFRTTRAIATGEYKPSAFGFGVYSYPILSSYYQAGIMRLFGTTLWAWRFGSVVIAALAVIPLYALAREMFNWRVAMTAGVILIVTPYFLAYARLGYNNGQAIFPVALAVYFLYAGFKRGSALYLCAAGVAAGLGFYTYTAGRLAVLVSLFFFIYLFITRQQAWWKLTVLGLAFSAGFLSMALPHLVYGNADNPGLLRYKMLESLWINADYVPDVFPDKEYLNSVQPVEVEDNRLYLDGRIALHLFQRGLARTLLSFNNSGLVGEHFIASPLAGPVTSVFYVLGLAALIAGWRERRFVLLGLWLALALLTLSILNTFPPRQAHLVPIMPVVALLSAVGLVALADFIGGRFPRIPTLYRPLPLTAGLMLIAYAGAQNYFSDMPRTYRPDLEAVMSWTALVAAPDEKLVYLYGNPDEKEFKPYIIRVIRPEVSYQTLAIDELDFFTPDPAMSYAAFYRADLAGRVIPHLQTALPDAQPPFTFLDRASQPLGGAVMNGTLALKPPSQIDASETDMFTPLVWWTAGLVVAGAIIYGLAWSRHAGVDGEAATAPSTAEAAQPAAPIVDLCIRLNLSKGQRVWHFTWGKPKDKPPAR